MAGASAAYCAPSSAIISVARYVRRGWSAAGTPMNSMMTVDGSGYVTSAMRSPPPAASIRSSSPSVISLIRGRIASTARGVNALLTSLRSRVWCGGLANGSAVPSCRSNSAISSRSDWGTEAKR